ncbi:murein hydrolase activator EnvC family protein [Streptomyces rubrolavendulae]|uniref:Peptidase family M23 n=1 Tax=Streptomyces rubrolavendulae TaxID=285473 RepID=A0A1D8G765_9ACTN|nr:M23 family metallopeptidase [Streptomyces rubrolavendulae]AOT61284.1 Peptidase family M23 [Streptomyces rubrolavendulae]
MDRAYLLRRSARAALPPPAPLAPSSLPAPPASLGLLALPLLLLVLLLPAPRAPGAAGPPVPSARSAAAREAGAVAAGGREAPPGGGGRGAPVGAGAPAGAGAPVGAGAAGGRAPVRAVWPVGPPRAEVVRGWRPPDSPYGRGHRGVDLAAPPGTPVRAAAGGRVSFAGAVGGRGVLVVTLDAPAGAAPQRITYEPVRARVAVGTAVAAGEVVGVTEAGAASHCAGRCLHWGLLRGDDYLDPLSLLPRRPPSRLLPPG